MQILKSYWLEFIMFKLAFRMHESCNCDHHDPIVAISRRFMNHPFKHCNFLRLFGIYLVIGLLKQCGLATVRVLYCILAIDGFEAL